MKRLIAEAYRLQLISGLEELLRGAGLAMIAGVDEAGRGCLAGPVVAAAVIMDPAKRVPGVDDSKRLSADQRAALAPAIKRSALAWSVTAISATEIDRTNILRATERAMRESLMKLDPAPDCALIDAVRLRDLPFPVMPLYRGESLSYSIACASVLAKSERDALMDRYHKEYPWYGFVDHHGYGSLAHREALEDFGPSPIHRLSFASVIPRHSRRAA